MNRILAQFKPYHVIFIGMTVAVMMISIDIKPPTALDPVLFSMQSTVATHDGQFDFSSHQPQSDPSTYAIIVSGERLTFTREQLESEPNNRFAEYFFGSASRPSTEKREMKIENEPALFKLIQAHLRGHNILPIRDGFVPYMTVEGVLENLLKEAKYYALGGLVQKLQNSQRRDIGSAEYILAVRIKHILVFS
jgi:hypothetical protein